MWAGDNLPGNFLLVISPKETIGHLTWRLPSALSASYWVYSIPWAMRCPLQIWLTKWEKKQSSLTQTHWLDWGKCKNQKSIKRPNHWGAVAWVLYIGKNLEANTGTSHQEIVTEQPLKHFFAYTSRKGWERKLVEGSALCKRKDGSEWANELSIYSRMNSKTTFPWKVLTEVKLKVPLSFLLQSRYRSQTYLQFSKQKQNILVIIPLSVSKFLKAFWKLEISHTDNISVL